jgi:hypothetical protein
VAIVASLAVLLSGCSELYSLLFAPSDKEIASHCGVTEAELKRAKLQAKELRPYKGRELGTCSIMVDETGHVAVMSIELPPKAGS